MLIRSQDGKKLGDYCEVYIEEVYDSDIYKIIGLPNGVNYESSVLGEFKTEKRAKEVLSEIAGVYSDEGVDNIKLIYQIPEE